MNLKKRMFGCLFNLENGTSSRRGRRGGLGGGHGHGGSRGGGSRGSILLEVKTVFPMPLCEMNSEV